MTIHNLLHHISFVTMQILGEIQTKLLLGAFTFSQRVPIIFDMCAHPSAHISLVPTEQSFITFFFPPFIDDGNTRWSNMQMEYTVAFP